MELTAQQARNKRDKSLLIDTDQLMAMIDKAATQGESRIEIIHRLTDKQIIKLKGLGYALPPTGTGKIKHSINW